MAIRLKNWSVFQENRADFNHQNWGHFAYKGTHTDTQDLMMQTQ